MIKLIPVRDILKINFGTDSWLVEELIHTGTLTVISGQPGSFKTWVCMHLALCVAEHKPFLGRFDTSSKRKVLILDKENHAKHLQTRLKALGVPEDTFIWYNFDEELRLDDKEDMNSLLRTIEDEKIGVVILDSLIRFHRSDENDSRQMSSVLSSLKKIANMGVNVIFTHHHRKESAHETPSSSSLRGSSDIFAAVDCHIALVHQKKDNLLIFSHMKSRQSPTLEAFVVKV